MNPLLAKLYPQLNLNAHMKEQARKAQLPDNVRENLKPKPEPKKHIDSIESKPEPKSEPKPEPKPQKRNIDDELDDYIGSLQKKYKDEPKHLPKYSKPPIRKRESQDEKKDRLLKQLSRKKISKAEQHIENVKQIQEEAEGDPQKIKAQISEARKKIKLLNHALILNEDENNLSNNNINEANDTEQLQGAETPVSS